MSKEVGESPRKLSNMIDYKSTYAYDDWDQQDIQTCSRIENCLEFCDVCS